MPLVVPRLFRRRFHKLIWSHVPRRFAPSGKPVTIILPLALKDLRKAAVAVESLRRHLLHPIQAILVPGQSHPDIAAFCAQNGLSYLDENAILPRAVLDLDYAPGGLKMNGHIRQQMLKLLAPTYAEGENFLAFDADTFLMRDLAFFDGDRQILFLADEYTKNLHVMTQKLLGPIARHPRSFIAHFMLLQRGLLADLARRVEARAQMPFVEAVLGSIDRTTSSSMSEYEIYGNFLNAWHRPSFVTRYWYNVKVDPETPATLSQLQARHGRMNSVSAHLH